MRPLFAIVPLVALLSWLGEPSGPDTAVSNVDTAATSSTGQVLARDLSASTQDLILSGSGPVLNGGHIMPVGWTAGR
jgi:hypothetical protein